MLIGKTEITVSGRVLKVARLRHEYFEYLADPSAFVEEIRGAGVADVLNFVVEAHVPRPAWPYWRQTAHLSLLKFKDFDSWWTGLNFKARNKARKAQKSGVELKAVTVDEEFLRGVEKIYNECPLRQGRPFLHYGKNAATIKNDLASFPECTSYVGAYFEGRLIGFMKLFEGEDILRTVHIIATLADRDKCVMDALIARAVEMASSRGIHHLHYGDWAYRGLGAFRVKFGFERHDCPRYFVPLNAKGALAMKLGLHRPFSERVPRSVKDRAAGLRNRWNTWRQGAGRGAAGDAAAE